MPMQLQGHHPDLVHMQLQGSTGTGALWNNQFGWLGIRPDFVSQNLDDGTCPSRLLPVGWMLDGGDSSEMLTET